MHTVLLLPLVVILGRVTRVGIGVGRESEVELAVLVIERQPRHERQAREERVAVVEALHRGIVGHRVGEVHAGTDLDRIGQAVVGVDAGGELLEVGAVGDTVVLLVSQGGVEAAAVGAGGSVDFILLQCAHAGEVLEPVVRAVVEQ